MELLSSYFLPIINSFMCMAPKCRAIKHLVLSAIANKRGFFLNNIKSIFLKKLFIKDTIHYDNFSTRYRDINTRRNCANKLKIN
jgi:hypothetical protein